MTHSNPTPRPVCILGLGLIGGSLMRALDDGGRGVFGWNRSPAGADAASAAGHDASTDLDGVLGRAADAGALIVVAVPMFAVDGVLARIAALAPGCPLTDVVSVKSSVRDAAARHGLLGRYVGGHPMAGTAESGWSATDPGLFRDAVWVVSVDAHVDAAVWREVVALAEATGAVAIPAESDEHDAAVARVSHLPHVLAEALAVVGASGGPLTLALGAGSFRDGTRVAGTAPALVRAMCETNSAAVITALDECLAELSAAREALTRGDMRDLAERGHAARLAFENRTRAVRVVDPGAPGWLDAARGAAAAGHAVTCG